MNLRWNSSEFGGVKDLRIPPHRIWKPDVLMYNRYDCFSSTFFLDLQFLDVPRSHVDYEGFHSENEMEVANFQNRKIQIGSAVLCGSNLSLYV